MTSPEAGALVRRGRSDAWTDLGLTLPVFLLYHLGVAFLPVRNAADVLTSYLRRLAENDLGTYVAITLVLGLLFVSALMLMGRGEELRAERFLWVALEGIVYAVAMRLIAGYVVGRLFMGQISLGGRLEGMVLSLGAGFYEELMFRVALFAGGGRLILYMWKSRGLRRSLFWVLWGVATSVAFSLWHHVGPGAEPFDLKVAVFRAVCGMFFTVVFAFRGFAPAVWTHALYDTWVLVV